LQKIDAAAEAEAYSLDFQRSRLISNPLAKIDEDFYIDERCGKCNDFSEKGFLAAPRLNLTSGESRIMGPSEMDCVPVK
jgi:hypothetical protein